MKIDETTIAIIRHLREGRKSFRKIADNLGITENTVRSRVNKLKKEGILEICGRVDPDVLPGHNVVFIGVKLKSMNLIEKAKELAALKGVVFACVVTGRFDVIMQVYLKEGFGLLEFYTYEMSQVENIGSVETFVVYKGYNMKIPYIL